MIFAPQGLNLQHLAMRLLTDHSTIWSKLDLRWGKKSQWTNIFLFWQMALPLQMIKTAFASLASIIIFLESNFILTTTPFSGWWNEGLECGVMVEKKKERQGGEWEMGESYRLMKDDKSFHLGMRESWMWDEWERERAKVGESKWKIVIERVENAALRVNWLLAQSPRKAFIYYLCNLMQSFEMNSNENHKNQLKCGVSVFNKDIEL